MWIEQHPETSSCVFGYWAIELHVCSSILTCPLRVRGRGQPIPADIGRGVGQTLVRSLAHHRTTCRDKTPLTLSPTVNVESSTITLPHLHACGLWEEAAVPRENRHEENVQTPQRKTSMKQGIELWTMLPRGGRAIYSVKEACLWRAR